MKLELKVSMPDGAVVVGVRGDIDRFTADDLYEFLATVIRQRGPRLCVDLAEVSLMHPTGVTALLRARELARSHGGDLTVAASSTPVALALHTGRATPLTAPPPGLEWLHGAEGPEVRPWPVPAATRAPATEG